MASNERNRQERATEDLKEMLQCSICKETFDDPRLLPCFHSFCLRCIQPLDTESKAGSGSKFLCPLCRGEFCLPSRGFDGLQKNFFMLRLLEVVNSIVNAGDGENICEACLEGAAPGEETPQAEMFCYECRQKFCVDCCKHHKRSNISRNHELIPIGNKRNNDGLQTRKAVPVYCKTHTQHPVDLYCLDCHKPVCPMCYIEDHQGHSRKPIGDASTEFRARIQHSIPSLARASADFETRSKDLDWQKSYVSQKAVQLEEAVKSARDRVKRLADEQAHSLLGMIHSAKEDDLEEIAMQRQDAKFKFINLDGYIAFSKELCKDGSDVDVCRMADWLIDRSTELQQVKVPEDIRKSSTLQKEFSDKEFEEFLRKNSLFSIDDVLCELRQHTFSMEEA